LGGIGVNKLTTAPIRQHPSSSLKEKTQKNAKGIKEHEWKYIDAGIPVINYYSSTPALHRRSTAPSQVEPVKDLTGCLN